MFDNFYGMLDIFSASVVLQYDDPTNHEIYDGFASGFVNYKKGTLDSQPQVIKFTSCFAHGRWFSLAFSTTKTGRHDNVKI
jgi:hypothetical protein